MKENEKQNDQALAAATKTIFTLEQKLGSAGAKQCALERKIQLITRAI